MKSIRLLKKVPFFLGIIMFTLSCVVFWGCGSKTTTIKLNNYITFTVKGYDTVGTATAEIDYDKLKADYTSKVKLSSTNNEEVKLAKAFGMTDIEIFLDCIWGNLDKSTELKNGDTINFIPNINNDVLNCFKGVKIEQAPITYTVSGLETIETFNPFDDIKVIFSGDNDDRRVTFEYSEDKYWEGLDVKYNTENATSTLKAGDKIKVVLSYERWNNFISDDNVNMLEFINKYNKIPSVMEKEYTVTSMEYVKSISDFTDWIPTLKTYVENAINTELSEHSRLKFSNTKLEYVGDFFQASKSGETVDISLTQSIINRYYLVYKVTADVEGYGSVTYYKPIYYNDIEKDSNGDYYTEGYNLGYNSITCGLDLPFATYINGYETFEDVKADILYRSYESDFNIENNL